jgi:chromosome segregation ATPase
LVAGHLANEEPELNPLENGLSEPPARDAEHGAEFPTPTPQDPAVQGRLNSEVAQNAVEWARDHLRQVASLRDELAAARAENDRLRADLEDLRSQAAGGTRREDDLRAEATAERDRARDALLARSDLERRLAEVEDQLRSTIEKSDRLESEAQSARSRLAELEEEIAQKPTHDDSGLKSAQLRIEQLTVDLDWARNANARLRSLLNVFGMVDHLESRPGSE